jgi:inosine-uridine nucleoside N-ribohydrolase
MNSNIALVMTGLDVTHKVNVTGEIIETIKN